MHEDKEESNNFKDEPEKIVEKEEISREKSRVKE